MKLYHGSKKLLQSLEPRQAQKGDVDVPENELLHAIYLTPSREYALAMAARPLNSMTTIQEKEKTITFEKPELFTPDEDIYVYEIDTKDIPKENIVHVDEWQYAIINTPSISHFVVEKTTSREILKFFTLTNWQENKGIHDGIKLVVAIVVCELAGIIGSLFTSSVSTWYFTINKPSFNPPSWIFGPVWITLYALMGIAAFLVWKKGLYLRVVKVALGIFIVQLVLNSLWSIIFFGLQSPGIAFIEIVILWLAILATMIWFAKVSKPACLLLLPYILWVSFAAFLNYSIWILN